MTRLRATHCHCLQPFVPGEYRVHSAFSHAINLTMPAGGFPLVSLVTYQKPLVPCGLKVAAPQMPAVTVGERVTLDATGLTFATWTLDTTLATPLDLSVSRGTLAPRQWPRVLEALNVALAGRTAGIPELQDEVWLEDFWEREGQSSERDWGALVRTLVGRGPGLTPSGDDFLCGWLWAWHRINHPQLAPLAEAVARTRTATTDISQNFLTLALEGYFVESLKMAEYAPLDGFRALREQGATSGVDTLSGVRFALTLASL